MADKNYLQQVQGDSDSADAALHSTTIDVTISASGRVGPYYPGNAKSVVLVTTGAASFQSRGSGGSGGLADSVYRDLAMGGVWQKATTSKVAGMTAFGMPHEFYILDTSGSSNPCTMYLNY